MVGAIFCEEDVQWEDATVGRLGKDAQPFGQEQPFVAPMPLLAE